MSAYPDNNKNKALIIIHNITSVFREYIGIMCVDNLMAQFQVTRLNGII
jgi:hypothetical protein